MAKIYGLFGSMTGKLADTVMAVRNGEQIARKYQPVVYNPSTVSQVAQRAKLKLISQLSAVMAPVIAIPRQGSISSRNLFTKKNFALTSYSENQATVTLDAIQLTKSVVALPAVGCSRGENAITAYVAAGSGAGPLDINRIVYCLFEKQEDGRLRFVDSKVATSAGNDGGWVVDNLPLITNECVLLAYGVRDNTEAARVMFSDMQTISAETIAKVVTNRTLTETDVTMTETRGYTLAVAQNHSVAHQDDENRSSKKK